MLELLRVIIVLGRYRICCLYRDEYKYQPIPSRVRFFATIIEIVLYPFRIKTHHFGEALCAAMQKLGPIYIKLGQTLSTRPDLIGHDVANSLKDLQDKLPAFDANEAIHVIEMEFCRAIHMIFSKFDNEPVAAASIAQVHKAWLHNGTAVAVKIIRPTIKEEYTKNIRFFYFIAGILEKYHPRWKPIEITRIFDVTMQRELDFMLEAASLSEMRDNFNGDESVYIPEVYWEATSSKVLTTSWVEGASIYNRDVVIAFGIDPIALSKKVAIMFFNQSYRDGFFHADMHPGNIFIMQDGRIALIDFGIVGRLSDNDRFAVAEILFGIVKRNYMAVAKTYLRAGYIPQTTDIFLFAQYCRAICEPIAGLPLKDVSLARIIEQLCGLTETFGMSAQPQLLLLQKSMIILEGIGKSLDNDINMWKLAEPWIKKWAAKNISPEAKFIRFIKKLIEEYS